MTFMLIYSRSHIPYCLKEAPVPERTDTATQMSAEEMQVVLDGLLPTDRIRIVFKDMPVEAIRIMMILVLFGATMHQAATLELSEMQLATLMAVQESGKWEGYRTYEATILEGFEPDDFAYRTLRHGLLESITRI